tara:strand:+ start:122 stop:307 length:186 start_codon:yes stop_codon:yes gene_type:complete
MLIRSEVAANSTEVDCAEEVLQIEVEDISLALVHNGVREYGMLFSKAMRQAVPHAEHRLDL